MSYLLEKSLILNKKQFNEDEEVYVSYDKYEIEGFYLLTQNKKPFFSIYDIANYCKKKYTNSKLFLIAHRYFDKVRDINITEFYIFNTVNIFEESLISILTIEDNELVDKQHVIQNSLEIAKKLLDCNDIHIILGDNTKEHEIVEYITSKKHNIDIVYFDKYDVDSKSSDDIEVDDKFEFKTTRISSILSNVRFIEPKGQKVKKYFILMFIVLLSFYGSEDITNSLFEQNIADTKRETRILQKKLNNIKKDIDLMSRQNNSLMKNYKKLNSKKIFETK